MKVPFCLLLFIVFNFHVYGSDNEEDISKPNDDQSKAVDQTKVLPKESENAQISEKIDGTLPQKIADLDNKNKTKINGSLTENKETIKQNESKEENSEDVTDTSGDEKQASMTIFFILVVIALSILVVYALLYLKIHYLPESVAVIFLGFTIGLILKIFSMYNLGNWNAEEHFPPTTFFLILLPPIIFESGYNLHKGNFFQNIGTILLFAIVGTFISAMVVGGGVFLLGKADVAYQLNLVESFAFGSLISAVDPVATLAIFSALDVDPQLYMLVFGESILNDAIAIVLTDTALSLASPEMAGMSNGERFVTAISKFLMMFFGSSAIGIFFGFLSAVLLKFIDLRKTPSLEIGMMLVFSYLPYGLSEGLELSGIMAILASAIVMSHYTHLNLSPITQITVQQTFRTIAFIAETCVFAYLGLAIFSFHHIVKSSFVIWSLVLVLIGRAVNIYPLSFIANLYREHKITKKNQFIMWFSGLRGAIAFALSLHLDIDAEKRKVIISTTLIIVLFTILLLGGGTMPLMKLLNAEKKKKRIRTRKGKNLSLSKTKEMGDTVDSEHLTDYTDTEDGESHIVRLPHRGFVRFDVQYLIPFFTRQFTQEEVKEGRIQMRNLTNQWYKEVRSVPSDEDDDEEDVEEHEIH